MEDDDETAPIIPTVSIQLDKADVIDIDYFFVSPHTTKIVIEALSTDAAVVGTITVLHGAAATTTTTVDDEESDYDEDEQLYRSILKSAAHQEISIPIYYSAQRLAAYCIVSHFSNAVTYNLVARQLVSHFNANVHKSWVTVSTSSFNNGHTLARLNSANPKAPSAFDLVPYLQPPHFITGVAASVNSVVNLIDGASLACLILNSDGQPGYEKLSTDAIVDAASVLAEFVTTDPHQKNQVVQFVSKAVRKFNSYSNSGMYL